MSPVMKKVGRWGARQTVVKEATERVRSFSWGKGKKEEANLSHPKVNQNKKEMGCHSDASRDLEVRR